jgi:hypothetical protein
LALALSSVFVLLCPGLVISPERFLGVSAGTSILLLGVGKNRGVGKPPTSAIRADSPSIDSAEKTDIECCELFSDDEKKAGCSVSRGLSYAFGIAGTGGTSKNSSVSSSPLHALLSPNMSLADDVEAPGANPVADDVVILGFGVGSLDEEPFGGRSTSD